MAYLTMTLARKFVLPMTTRPPPPQHVVVLLLFMPPTIWSFIPQSALCHTSSFLFYIHVDKLFWTMRRCCSWSYELPALQLQRRRRLPSALSALPLVMLVVFLTMRQVSSLQTVSSGSLTTTRPLDSSRILSNSNHAVLDDSSRRRVMLTMATRDGKQRRKKKEDSPSPSPTPSQTSSSSTPQPMRVTTDINIPIRRQIQFGRLNKQFRESGSSSFRQSRKLVRTKYRRTWDEEEIEQKAEERKRKGQDPDWDVVLNQTTAAPLVIVDGYNVIYKWSRLKKHMAKGDTGKARQLLVEDLENMRSLKGWRIEVVFDGAGRNLVGPLGDKRGQRKGTAFDRATSKDVSKHGVRTVFTGAGVEADSYIEARCAEAKNVTLGAKTGTFIVATDDALIRIAGESAGALCMSSERFVNELKAVKKSMEHRVEAAMAKVNGQAMRPEKLWGSKTFIPLKTNNNGVSQPKRNGVASSGRGSTNSSTAAPIAGAEAIDEGKFVYKGRFGRGSLLIEDKRKKPSKDRKETG